MEQLRAVANPQEGLEGFGRHGYVDGLGSKRGIRQQWLHERPLRLVYIGRRKTDSPVIALFAEEIVSRPVSLIGPVHFGIPVAGVVAVVVHVLRAKQIVAAEEEWNALA